MPTYLGALIFGLPIWIFLFYFRKDLRHKMLIMSIILAFIAPVDTFFIPGYWHPITIGRLFGLPIDIFTVLFAFTAGGIACVLYETILRKGLYRRNITHHPLRMLLLFGPIIILFLKYTTSLNFMYDFSAGLIVMILSIIIVRRDLLLDTIISGIFFAMLYSVLLSMYLLLFPNVIVAWNLEKFPQVFVFNVPYFEIIWAFLMGAVLGPIYEYYQGLSLRKLKLPYRNRAIIRRKKSSKL